MPSEGSYYYGLLDHCTKTLFPESDWDSWMLTWKRTNRAWAICIIIWCGCIKICMKSIGICFSTSLQSQWLISALFIFFSCISGTVACANELDLLLSNIWKLVLKEMEASSGHMHIAGVMCILVQCIAFAAIPAFWSFKIETRCFPHSVLKW